MEDTGTQTDKTHLPWEGVHDGEPDEQAAELGRLVEADEDLRPMVALADEPGPDSRTGAHWTIPLLCVGITMIACCVLIPLSNETRQAAYERRRLQSELDYVVRQVDANKTFLHDMPRDPTLGQRMAQLQMKAVPAGTAVLPLSTPSSPYDQSPFQLVHLPPPPAILPYQPPGDWFSQLFLKPKSQLYLLGLGMFMVAASLVLGGPRPNFALASRQED